MTALRILAPTRYLWTFNGPKHSRHIVERRGFLPLNLISKRIEATTIFNPWPPKRFDLVHAFNRIPLGTTPFIIGFESHLPRAYGLEKTSYFRQLCRILACTRCRGIFPISEHARTVFEAMHGSGPWREALFSKVQVRLPNIDIPGGDDPLGEDRPGPLTISFVGNHFGRKGGCVAVKVAELALARKVPLCVEVVSSLQVGNGIWTDPSSPAFFDPYLELINLPNVRWHGSMDNQSVIDLLRRSHFSLLATFGDTFGFSVLESMANSTPVIATRQGALPEFIEHRRNGILLDLPTSGVGEWIHSSSPYRATKRFEKIFAEEVDRLAHETLDEILAATGDAKAYRSMRREAKETARRLFDARAASVFWDDTYERAFG